MAIDLQHCRDNFHQRAAVQDAGHEALRLQTRKEAISAIREIVPTYPEITQVYLFGSITQPGHFHPHSDIDIAVAGTSAAAYFALWRDLEAADLNWAIDLREINQPGHFADIVRQTGELVYESPSRLA
ncbi:MAG: nucleotidyltransferase domain-containing protein [Leptolyngbya sp. RL_3_1]|nr:nucleotidyltransferase domain-containing protein [Leptolyngbya sp. RL_3_1]